MRLLAKFVENTYEKVDRLLDIREGAGSRLKVVDKEIETERMEMKEAGETIGEVDEDRWYLRRLDGGLYTLQVVDYILAWVCMEDDGVCYSVPSGVLLSDGTFAYSFRLVDTPSRC